MRVTRKILNLVLISNFVHSRICGVSEGLSGSFKHLQHRDSAKETCFYHIRTRDSQSIKLTFAKYVSCDQAVIKVIDKNGEHGPYCEPTRANQTGKYINMKVISETEFDGPDVKIVFEPGESDKTARMRVNFEWKTVTDYCQLSSFASTDDPFKQIARTTNNADATSMWILLTDSISSFGQHFLADYQAYCNLKTMTPRCELVQLSQNETIGAAMSKMEMLIRHITTNCVKGFGYRWFDAFNRLAFLTGHPYVDNWSESAAEVQVNPPRQLINFETATRKIQTTKSTTTTTAAPDNTCPWKAQTNKRKGCQVKHLETCNLHLFEDALTNKRISSGYECDFSDAVSEMGNIFDYIVALAANKGTFQNHCATTKNFVPCSLVTIDADKGKAFKPLNYIRKMKGIARKLTNDCDSSHREEISNMFKHVWASIKVCGPNQTDDLMGAYGIGQRTLGISGPMSEPSFDLDEHEVRTKEFCKIDGYFNRNMKTFMKRVGNAAEPEVAIDLFSEISNAISNLGGLVTTMPHEVCFLDGREGNRIPCDMAFVPKNEEACQLAQRLEAVINYLSARCAVLLNVHIGVRISQLHEATKPIKGKCPQLGDAMSRNVRRKMIDV